MHTIKHSMTLKKCIILFIFLFTMLADNAFASFSSIVAFGDSLTDHGGLHSYVLSARDVWSNGNTWVEYFADELQASLDNNAIAGAKTEGHEDASIQALSDAENNNIPQLGLIGQVNTYLDSSPSYSPSTTLFTIWIGGNDLLEFGRGDAGTDNPIVLISGAMTHIQTAINNLYEDGAVNFLILNLPDIGVTPLYNSRTPQEIADATALTNNYNAALYNLVTSLRTNMPGATIQYFDVFSYMHDMIDQDYFANTTGTYMELDGSGDYTGNINGPAEDYLFWDSIHPTTRAHEYLGKKVAQNVVFSENDDDSDCFISTSTQRTMKPADVYVLSALAFLTAIVLTGFATRKTNRP